MSGVRQEKWIEVTLLVTFHQRLQVEIIANDVLRSRAGRMMREAKDVLMTTSLPLSNVIIEEELLSDDQLAFSLVEIICRYFQV